MRGKGTRQAKFRGRIATLTYELREEICRRIRDGQTDKAIADWLTNEQRIPTRLDQVENWRDGGSLLWPDSGYKEWLRKEERVEASERLLREAQQCIAKGGTETLHEAINLKSAEIIWKVVNAFNNDDLAAACDLEPERILDVAKTGAALGDRGLAFAKYRAEAKSKLDTLEKSGVISAEALAKIKSDLSLL